MKEEFKRIPIYKYSKSGKISAVYFNSKIRKYTILDMSPDLRRLEKLRSVTYLKRDSIVPTYYILETIEKSERVDSENYNFSYKYLRVLTQNDLNREKWRTTKSLSDLPVGTQAQVTEEERTWAGEKGGNIEGGIGLLLLFIGALWWLYCTVNSNGKLIFPLLAASVIGFFLFRFKWRSRQKPSPEKLAELNTYKEQLRKNEHTKNEKARTEIEVMLKDYSNWELLSPEQFEQALQIHLKEEGYDLQATKYIGDGGIDLEGVNGDGKAIVVQAKKYRGNVGVAVVREMIGVRESHPQKPLAMIISLVGFTRGAIQLATQENVILKSVKKDILKV